MSTAECAPKPAAAANRPASSCSQPCNRDRLCDPRVVAMRLVHAAGIDAFGGQVRLLELPAAASPEPDEVVIRVHAAGVGNWDEFVRIGAWDVGREPPLALGVEAAG